VTVPVDIEFADGSCRKLCEQAKHAQKKLGPDCAKKLRTRLADLTAAASVGGLVAGDPHPLTGDREGQFSVSLAGGMRLVFTPNHDPVPQLPAGGIDWQLVTKVRIVFIGNYHD
jgi:proteic killer suppression protein